MDASAPSGERGGYDGAKRRKGTKVHLAVDTLGHALTLHVTAADEQDRAQVAQSVQAVSEVIGDTVEVAFVNQGDTGDDAASQAGSHGIDVLVIKHTQAKRGFVLLLRRWVVERSVGWAARLRRLARDYERLTHTLAERHDVAFACLMFPTTVSLFTEGTACHYGVAFVHLACAGANATSFEPCTWADVLSVQGHGLAGW